MCTLATLTHAHTHTPGPPTFQRSWFMTWTLHRRYTQQSHWKKNKWQRDTESEQSNYWFQVSSEKVEKKVSSMREIYPSPWWADCKQLHKTYSGCMLWLCDFHCISLTLQKQTNKRKHDRRWVKRPASHSCFEHFKIHLRFTLNPVRLDYPPCPHIAAQCVVVAVCVVSMSDVSKSVSGRVFVGVCKF